MNASQAFENAALTSYLPTMTPASGMNASSNKCMMEVIQIVSAHTADVLVHIMKIISEKYGHPIPEMMEVVRTNPAFHAIQMHPILTTDFFNIPAVTPVAAAPTVPVPILAPKKVTKIVRKKTDTVTTVAPTPAPIPTPAANPTSPKINTETASSPTAISPPVSPLSQVVVIETPPNSTVINVSAPTTPTTIKKATVIIKKKESSIEADKKEVKPHTY